MIQVKKNISFFIQPHQIASNKKETVGDSIICDNNLSVSKVCESNEQLPPSNKQKSIDKILETMAPVKVAASDILLKNRENLLKTLDKNSSQLEDSSKEKSPLKKEEEIESFLQRKNRLLAQKELLLKKKKEERELQLKQYHDRQRVRNTFILFF